MSEHERGAYTPPTDDPLAFDARAPRSRRPLPTTLIASGAVLVVMIAAVFVFYRSGVRGADEPPRAVGKSLDQIRVQAVEEARPVEAQPALDIYSAGAANPAGGERPRFTDGPEEPAPRPVADVSPTPAPAAQTVTLAPPPPVAAPLRPATPAPQVTLAEAPPAKAPPPPAR